MTPGSKKEVSLSELAGAMKRLADGVTKISAFKNLSSLGLDANIIVTATPEDAKVQAEAENLMKGKKYKILKGDPKNVDAIAREEAEKVSRIVTQAILTHVIGKL
jgi:hypothetical protein